MDENQDYMNNDSVKKVFSELAEKMHFSHEMILSWAQGRLSEEGAQKVSKHVKECKQCSEIYNIIRNSESQAIDDTEESVPPMSGELKAKLDFVSRLNAQKDEITEKIAMLFLDRQAWPAIKPAILVIRKWDNSAVSGIPQQDNKLSVAAFAGQSSAGKRKDYEQILNVVSFTDTVSTLLAEKCENVDDLKSELAECIMQAEDCNTKLQLTDEMRRRIEELFLENI